MSYDRFPEASICGYDDQAWEGAEAVRGELARLVQQANHTLVVECYPGV